MKISFEPTYEELNKFMNKYRNSHSVEIADALIAVVVKINNCKLWILNKKALSNAYLRRIFWIKTSFYNLCRKRNFSEIQHFLTMRIIHGRGKIMQNNKIKFRK